MLTEGVVAFSCVTKNDVYNGQDTGKKSVTIVINEDEARKLEDLGVRVKQYEDKEQRKFTSKYPISVVDVDGDPFTTEIPRGSRVRVKWKLGGDFGNNGNATYAEAIRVLELGTSQDEGDDEF